MYPSCQRRSGSWLFFLWPCCLSPSPGGSVYFGGLAVFHFTWAFHALVLHTWWLASSTSGRRTSRKGLLAYVQGASDSLPHPSSGCEVEGSIFGIAVRALLQATSLPHCMESSSAPGQGLSVSAFKWPCGIVVACLLHTQEVPGSIPGRGSYLRQVSLH